MIPLRDENPTRRFPWVTILLIAVNIAVFAYQATLSPSELNDFWTAYAFVPARFLASPLSPGVWLTVFAAMFMHAGWLHIGGNMLYLWIFGNNVEDHFGPVRFLGFYLLAGLAGTFAQTAMAPTAQIPTLGASGAIAGVLGAYALLFPNAKVLTIVPIWFFIEVARVPAYLVIGFWFLLQLAQGVGSLGTAAVETGGVAFFAHIGGFLAGLALTVPAYVAARRRRVSARRSR